MVAFFYEFTTVSLILWSVTTFFLFIDTYMYALFRKLSKMWRTEYFDIRLPLAELTLLYAEYNVKLKRKSPKFTILLNLTNKFQKFQPYKPLLEQWTPVPIQEPLQPNVLILSDRDASLAGALSILGFCELLLGDLIAIGSVWVWRGIIWNSIMEF